MERIILEDGFGNHAWAVTMNADSDRRERSATWRFPFTSAVMSTSCPRGAAPRAEEKTQAACTALACVL